MYTSASGAATFEASPSCSSTKSTTDVPTSPLVPEPPAKLASPVVQPGRRPSWAIRPGEHHPGRLRRGGNYASSMLLPHIVTGAGIELARVATRRSLSAVEREAQVHLHRSG